MHRAYLEAFVKLPLIFFEVLPGGHWEEKGHARFSDSLGCSGCGAQWAHTDDIEP
jgi:hypothetical protein